MLHTYSRLHPPLYTGFALIFGTKATAVPQFSPSSPYFFIDLSGRKYPEWMFCQVYQCCKFPTSHRNQLTVSVYCSLLQPKLQTRKNKSVTRVGCHNMVKSWLDRNNLHNSTEYIFFMVGMRQYQKLAYIVHIPLY